MFLRASGGTLHAQNFFLDSLPGQIYCSFSYLLSLPSSKSLFSSSWSFFVSILSSQADRPTLKNVGFMRAGARFSKNHVFGSKDALDGVLGLSWAHFGCSWGLLGGILVFLRAFGGTLTSQDFCFGALEASSCPPRSPQQLSGRPQSEADGPPKSPKDLGRRLAAYFSEI